MIFSAIFGKKDHGSVVVASVVSMLSCHRVYAKLTVYVCRCIFGPYVHIEHSGLKFTKFFIHDFSCFLMVGYSLLDFCLFVQRIVFGQHQSLFQVFCVRCTNEFVCLMITKWKVVSFVIYQKSSPAGLFLEFEIRRLKAVTDLIY